MKPLNIGLVAAVGGVALALGALTLAVSVRYGSAQLVVTPWISLLFVAIGVWLLVGGRGVRRLKARKETWVTAPGAARIAALARATSYVASGSSGFLLGTAVVAFTRLWAPAMATAAWTGLAGGLTALFACISACVVERWCIDTSSDDQDRGNNRRSAPQAQGN